MEKRGSKPGVVDMAGFMKSVYQAIDLERQDEIDAAIEAWENATRCYRSHAAAFTRRIILQFRRVWGLQPAPRPREPGKKRLTMTSLGVNGRYGNQLLQYAFIRVLAQVHGYQIEVADWIGRDIFGHDDPFPGTPLPRIRGDTSQFFVDLLANDPGEVDIFNTYLGSTHIFAPYKDVWYESFRLGPKAAAVVAPVIERLAEGGRTLVALHIRRGDYVHLLGATPIEWYVDWLKEIWPALERPILYVASDETAVAQRFAAYQPITCSMVAPGIFPGGELLIDFEVLRRADRLAASNSTFSVIAAMLNRVGQTFRPDPVEGKIGRFDPWNTPMLTEHPTRPLPREAVDPCRPVSREADMAARKFIGPDSTIFSFGAATSPWARHVLDGNAGCSMHLFGDSAPDFEAICAGVGPHIHRIRLSPYPVRKFCQTPEWPDNLDGYCRDNDVSHIDFVNLGEDCDAAAILWGAEALLGHARIDVVQFPCDRANPQWCAVFQGLEAHGFQVFRSQGDQPMVALGAWSLAPEDGGCCIAVHERLLPLIGARPRVGLEVPGLLETHGVAVRGVIAAGMPVDFILSLWPERGVDPLLAIEGRPKPFAHLAEAAQGIAGVRCIQRLLGSEPGTARLPVPTDDAAASILPMARYPAGPCRLTDRPTVELRQSRLDEVVAEAGFRPDQFQLLALALQGTELAALRGAIRVLDRVRAVNLRVYFEDVFAGCPQIDQIDDFMGERGFFRVALTSPVAHGWGDALYLRSDRYAPRDG